MDNAHKILERTRHDLAGMIEQADAMRGQLEHRRADIAKLTGARFEITSLGDAMLEKELAIYGYLHLLIHRQRQHVADIQDSTD